MCGINGLYAYRGTAGNVDRMELVRTRDRMAARGPDGCGEWFSQDGRAGLGHRRLSIIDLSQLGAQPMHSADGKLVIVFNGEIFNYRSLRSELEARGCVFRSQSDTEVLLHLYAAAGAAMVERLRGMFAFAIWDAERRGLLLARDPFGIKPLYYADDGRTLRFASQVKALIAGGAVSQVPDAAGWVGFYMLGSVPEPFTIYRAIRALPAGSTAWVDAGGMREPSQYYCVAQSWLRAEADTSGASPAEKRQQVRAALLDSVRHHMVADVPVGIFLSSGIDSGALLGLMRDAGQQDIEAVTLTYGEYRDRHEDEGPLAARCAAHYGSRHQAHVLTEQEFRADLPRIFEAMDQPTIDGINTWFVSKAARELGIKAAISGLGGDELFGGYPSFRDVPRWVATFRPFGRLPVLGRMFRYFATTAGLSSILNPKAAGLLEYGGSYAGAWLLRRGLFMPWELNCLLDPEAVREGLDRLEPIKLIARALDPEPRTGFAKVAALETALYMRNQLLRDTDWASMAHSVEVRVPLVDLELLRAVAPAMLRDGAGKQELAASPRVPLPANIADRRKTGFTIPIKEWLARDQRQQNWRGVAELARPSCPWARRWAYQVAAA